MNLDILGQSKSATCDRAEIVLNCLVNARVVWTTIYCLLYSLFIRHAGVPRPYTTGTVDPKLGIYDRCLLSMLANLFNEETKHAWLSTKQVFNFVKGHVVRASRLLEDSPDEENRAVTVNYLLKLGKALDIQAIVNYKLSRCFSIFWR